MRRTALGAAVVFAVIVSLVVLVAANLWPSLTRVAPSNASVSTIPTAAIVASTPSVPPSVVPRPSAAASQSSTIPATTHVWWIVMENHEYGAIIGSAAAPYLNDLASRYGLAANYYATGHPSEPNYVAMVAGSTLGVTGDGTYNLAGPSLFAQLTHAGLRWRAYEQDYPGVGCFTGGSSDGGVDGPGAAGTYARKHDPAMSFTAISGDRAECADIQPLRAFDPAAAAFAFITPNLTNDMHDGSIGQGDAFLRAFVPMIVGSAAFSTGVLFVTFDEGSSNTGTNGDSGGHVATLIIAPRIGARLRFSAYADHFSLLRTTEDILGLPCLAAACLRSAISY